MLPITLPIYGHTYQLAGSTVCSGNHFTAGIAKRIMSSQRMQIFKPSDVQNKITLEDNWCYSYHAV